MTARGRIGQIVVISLDRTPDRWRAFLADNPAQADAERFPAVDGRSLSRDSLIGQSLMHPDLGYTAGAMGCALSHVALWRRCVASDEPLTVVEDDAVLREDFGDAAARIVALEPACEIVLWSWNFDSVLGGRVFGETPFAMGFDQAKMRVDLPAFQADRTQPTRLRLHRALGTPAYTVTPAGASQLLELCLPLRPQSVFLPLVNRETANTGIDIPMNAAYPQMAAYVSFPPLAVTRNLAADSTVA